MDEDNIFEISPFEMCSQGDTTSSDGYQKPDAEELKQWTRSNNTQCMNNETGMYAYSTDSKSQDTNDGDQTASEGISWNMVRKAASRSVELIRSNSLEGRTPQFQPILLRRASSYTEGEMFAEDECWATGPMLGRGSYGTVYKSKLNTRSHAIKVMTVNASLLAKVITEAEVGCMLAHPNIVRTFGYRVVEYTDDFSAFRPPSSSSSFSLNFGDSQEEVLNDNRFKMYKVAVMQEQCDIGPLRSVICREGFFERPNISRIDFVGMISIDICRALMHFENEGMGHNDLSSSNVLLATDPSTPLGMRAKVGDFGLCCPNNRSREVGTIPYMAPELLQVGSKHKGSKTDIYSLGVLMLEMWMGQYAWHPLKPMHIFYNIGLGKRLDVPDDVPEPLSRLVKQCLSDNAEERPSAHDAYEVLCQLTDPSLVLSHQITQCNIQQMKMEVKVSDEKEIIECTQKK